MDIKNKEVLFVMLDGSDEQLKVSGVNDVSVVGIDENGDKRFIKKELISDYIVTAN